MSYQRITPYLTCAVCSREFVGSQPNARYCGAECRKSYGREQARNRARALKGQPPRFAETVTCARCHSPFRTTKSRQKFCTTECRRASYVTSLVVLHPSQTEAGVVLTKGTTGAAAELRAAADLMLRGFHVFRAMSPACPCDLVVWRVGGPVIRVEVKTARTNAVTGTVSFQKAPRNIFDAICHVTHDEVIYEPPISEW